MTRPTALTDNDREDLVAFLDGELDAESTNALEAKLQLDPRARREAEELRKTWELLDFLPRAQASVDFTQQTLEKVSDYRPAPPRFGRLRWNAWTLAVAWTLACLLAGVTGFAAVRLTRPKPVSLEEQWIARLPRAHREQIEMASAPERPAVVQAIRDEEDKQEKARQATLERWTQKRDPALARQDVQELQIFIREYLLPRLSPAERERIAAARGNPHLVKAVQELADSHPLKLPGPAVGPTRFEELPKDVKEALRRGLTRATWNKLQASKKDWPDYAIAVTQAARADRIALPRQLGPSRLGDFPPSMKSFVTEKLLAVLSPEAKDELGKAEGQWPEYPQTVLKLADRHQLAVPGMAPPGPKEFWERVRRGDRF